MNIRTESPQHPAAAAGETPVLSIRDLHAQYGDSRILQGCTLSLGRECATVLGRNGMGKTTLMRSIMGLTPASGGQVLFKGIDITDRKPQDIAALGIGYVPQGRRLFPSLTVREHLALTHRTAPGRSRWTPRRIFDLFPELWDRRDISGTLLSGGEQQMLAIGRALVTNPELLLLDEPSEGLSPVANERVIATCRELLKEGLSILLVEQSIHVAEALADTIHILVSGQTVHHAPAAEFLADESLRQKFLGI